MTKKLITLLAVACIAFHVNAQEPSSSKEKITKISFNSQSEKELSIKEQEARLKINQSDPTYPKDLLQKEKKQLEAAKKATIVKTIN
jgi:Flp pilus assembly protein TadB